eukprot:6492714-Amphidinium_carterae.1
MDIDSTGYEPNAGNVEPATSALVPRSPFGNVPLGRSPFGQVQTFDLATPRRTPQGTPRAAQLADVREEFLRGALEQALRENREIRANLGEAELAEQSTRADMAAGVAWARAEGEMAMRAMSALRNEADQVRQQALFEQSENFVRLYQGCMETQERAAEVIETLRSENASGETARRRDQEALQELRSQVMHAESTSDQLSTVPGRSQRP